VLPTIHLDDQLRFKTAETGDMGPERPLATEFVTPETPATKLEPQRLFRIGGIAPHWGGMRADCSADDTHGRADNKKKTLIPAFSRKREKGRRARLRFLV
jgi:hypothetical protein